MLYVLCMKPILRSAQNLLVNDEDPLSCYNEQQSLQRYFQETIWLNCIFGKKSTLSGYNCFIDLSFFEFKQKESLSA